MSMIETHYTNLFKKFNISTAPDEILLKQYINIIWNDPETQLIRGTLLITNRNLIFLPDKEQSNYFKISLCQISSINKEIETNSFSITKDAKPIIILAKSLEIFVLYTNLNFGNWSELLANSKPNKQFDVHTDIISYLSNVCFFDKSKLLEMCLSYMCKENDGWDAFCMAKEFARMALDEKRWSLSDFNADYSLCESYPSQLILPAKLTKSQVFEASNNHEGFRLPVLTWSDEKSTIITCSQVAGNHFLEANKVFLDQLSASIQPKSILHYVYLNGKSEIADQQGEQNSQVNAKSMCYKSLPTCSELFMNYQSFNKYLIENGQTKLFLSTDPSLMKNNWFQNIKQVLKIVENIGDAIGDFNFSVMLIGKPEYNSIPLISSLLQLILDPFYRTFEGFYALVEKEWCSFGHPFYSKNGHGKESKTFVASIADLNRSLVSADQNCVFILFLDCCYQIMRQYPHEFQFTHFLLLLYAQELYSCRYGNFLTDCEKEREELLVKTKANSLWTLIESERKNLRAHVYNKQSKELLIPNKTDYIYFWKEFYTEKSANKAIYHFYRAK